MEKNDSLLSELANQIRDEIDREILEDLSSFWLRSQFTYGAILRRRGTDEMWVVLGNGSGDDMIIALDPDLNKREVDYHDFDILRKGKT